MLENRADAELSNDQDRIRRIGGLLARAVARRSEREARESAASQSLPDLEITDPIVLHIARVGECSPSEIREWFSLKRTTAFRRLKALVDNGQLEQVGNTRSTRYRIAA